MPRWLDWFWNPVPPTSVGGLILETQKYKQSALYLSIGVVGLTAAIYLQLIYPAFLPESVVNPAVTNFMASDSLRQNTEQFFSDLKRYNERRPSEPSIHPNEFLAVDSSQFGLVVTLYYRLVQRDSDRQAGEMERSISSGPHYSYKPDISVRPSLPILIPFIAFEAMLCLWIVAIWRHKPHAAQLEFEGRALREYFSDDATTSGSAAEVAHVDGLISLLKNFHVFCIQLNDRHAGRPGLVIQDEYDVQDVLHALLRLHFKDVRAEECCPSYAGAASRMDFLLHDEEVVIETKMAREGLRDRELGKQLIIDVAQYSAHPKCKTLVCLVYDPRNLVENPAGLQADISALSSRLHVEVVFSPIPTHC